MIKALQFLCLLILIFSAETSFAQVAPPQPGDTLREINLIFAKALRFKTIDSVTKLQIVSGSVRVNQGGTKFTCDSAIINQHSNVMEAFGNVHINQGDSVFTSSQYIKYLGNERLAYLKRNVKLTDKKATLLTNDLEYDLKSGIGKYHNGGKVINAKTTISSTEGIYYEDTKDAYFINKVDVVDLKTKTKIKADSLLYNSLTQKLNFIGPTYIKNKNGEIFTTQGYYDLSSGTAFFANRSLVKDSSGRTYQANNIAIDDKSGEAQLEGNAIIKDSASRFIATGNQIFMNQKNNSFLATKKPVMIFWENKDTTYLAGDTIFSGYTKRVYAQDIVAAKDSSAVPLSKDSVNTLLPKKSNSKFEVINKTKDTIQNKTDTSIRYFIAYHHVKIFNDSLQSVSDSLFYSGADSTFRLFHNPVVWSGNSQVTGDTIYLFTKNKKAEHVYVFDNGMMINRINGQAYNQVAGKTINGYFKSGVIDYIKVKGSPAESVYYVQDNKDSSFTGMNHADGSVIDMYFIKQQLDQVKFLNDVHGVLYPIRQIPPDKKFLKNFNWLDKRRPKNKLELFE